MDLPLHPNWPSCQQLPLCPDSSDWEKKEESKIETRNGEMMKEEERERVRLKKSRHQNTGIGLLPCGRRNPHCRKKNPVTCLPCPCSMDTPEWRWERPRFPNPLSTGLCLPATSHDSHGNSSLWSFREPLSHTGLIGPHLDSFVPTPHHLCNIAPLCPERSPSRYPHDSFFTPFGSLLRSHTLERFSPPTLFSRKHSQQHTPLSGYHLHSVWWPRWQPEYDRCSKADSWGRVSLGNDCIRMISCLLQKLPAHLPRQLRVLWKLCQGISAAPACICTHGICPRDRWSQIPVHRPHGSSFTCQTPNWSMTGIALLVTFCLWLVWEGWSHVELGFKKAEKDSFSSALKWADKVIIASYPMQ